MDHYQKCLQKFNEMPDYLRDAVGGDLALDILEKIEKKYNVSLSFPVIMIAIGELSINDLPVYLHLKYNLSITAAIEIEKKLFQEIFYPFEEITGNIDFSDTEKEFSVDSEKNIKTASIILKENLVTLLKENADTEIAEINKKILFLLSEDTIKERLIDLLYHNQEKLVNKNIVFNKEKVSFSVGNWIKFYKKHNLDSSYADVDVLNFINKIKTDNSITEEDQRLLLNIIQIYRNIYFFPDSMDSMPSGRWEIIPSRIDNSEIDNKKDITGPPLTKGEKEVAEMRREAGEFAEGSIERLAIAEEIEKKRHIEDLKAERNKYKEGSLEWSALSTEINHLEAE